MNTVPTFTKPWFRILDVREGTGQPISEITKEVCDQMDLAVADVRGMRRFRKAVVARNAILTRIFHERPDLSSNQVARFFNREGSTIRHFWAELRERKAA